MPPLPPPRAAASAARPERVARWGLALALPLVACAGAPPHADGGARTAQTLVEVLPGRAELRVDGRLVGRGGRVLAVPDPAHTYRIEASAPGFVAAERAEPGAQLDGARVALVLSPVGMASAEIDPDDAQALASAAEALLLRGEDSAAGEYARRAASLAPGLPAARHVLDALGVREERGIEVRHRLDGSER